MNSSFYFPGNNTSTTTMVPFNELIVENTTFLISPDHEPEFWSKDPFYINATTTAIVPTSVLLAENETMKLAFDSPIVSAVKLAIFMMIHSPLGTSCVQSCSNILRSSLVSIVGPSNDEVLAPFHSVVAKSRTNIAAQRKIAWVCHSMKKFDHCIRPCLDSKAKAVRMINVEQWHLICDASKKYPKHFGEFIGCEKRHHERALRKCPAFKVSPASSLDSFCKSINDYTDCYSKVIFRCSSKNATQIWTTINSAIRQSYSRILELTAGQFDLPVECEWAMRNSDLYRHEDERNENDEYQIEPLSWSTTITSSTTTSRPTLTEPQTTRQFEAFPSSGPPPSITTQPTSNTIPPQHRHREFENDEYSLDYWQGVSEHPFVHPLQLTTPNIHLTTTTENSNQRTPFLANAFQNGLSSQTNCSIVWRITSMFILLTCIIEI